MNGCAFVMALRRKMSSIQQHNEPLVNKNAEARAHTETTESTIYTRGDNFFCVVSV